MQDETNNYAVSLHWFNTIAYLISTMISNPQARLADFNPRKTFSQNFWLDGVSAMHYTSALKIQHLSQKKLALRLLQYSFKIWLLSAINKWNQKKISNDEKPPVKHFLERKNPELVAFWPEAHLLHILRKILKFLKSKPGETWYEDS